MLRFKPKILDIYMELMKILISPRLQCAHEREQGGRRGRADGVQGALQSLEGQVREHGHREEILG